MDRGGFSMFDDTTTMPFSVISKVEFLKFFNLHDIDIDTFSISRIDNELIIDVSLSKQPTKCPCCLNITSKVKDYSSKKITHSILNNSKCTIIYHARRYVCPRCKKTFYEHNPFTMAGSKLSLATVYNVLNELKNPSSTFISVAKRFHISPTTVANVFDSFVSIPRKRLPEYICIDEVYAFKSENSKYICVLVDFKTHDIIDVLPSRQKRTLMDYFFAIPIEERKQVKVISFDMWETYRVISNIMFPKAVCALDRFHVMQEFTKRFNRVRVDVMNKYYQRQKYLERKEKLTIIEKTELVEAKQKYYLLKKFNWLLTSNDKRITDPNVEKKYNKALGTYHNYYSLYSSIIENDPILENAVILKSELDDFYKNSTIETAKANIELLIREFNQSTIKEMNNFSNTLIKWKYEIINSFTVVNNKRITNGIIENRNKSIKLLKHSSNGYLNWKRFRNRIMFSLNKDSTYHMYPIRDSNISND